MPLSVTAVITAHDRRAFLPSALRSVVAAGADEIVVVRNFDDPVEGDPGHVRYVHCDVPETGEKQARGIENATGELVALLDDDDLWEPNKLSVVRQRFVEQPELVYLNHAQHPIGPDGAPVTAHHPELAARDPGAFARWDGKDLRTLLERIFPGNSSSTCLRRAWAREEIAALRQVGWSADTFWLVVAWLDRRPLTIIPDTLTKLRLHTANMSQTRGSNPAEFRSRHETMCRRFAASNAALAQLIAERRGDSEPRSRYCQQNATGFEFLADLEADRKPRSAAWAALRRGPGGRDAAVRRAALATLVSPGMARNLLYRSNLNRWRIQ